MEIRPIHTKKEYLAALSKIEKLWNAPSKSLEGYRLEVLTLLVEQYEKVHYPIQDSDHSILVRADYSNVAVFEI
jgi:HTH-type transcriptional regulator/antitoxin HigA